MSIQTANDNALMTMLKSDNVKNRFIETVGPGGGAWITAIINAANLNPKIWECEPVSVITAGLNAATLRLSLDGSTGQAAILPFRSKGKYKAVFVPMVRGLKQLALRTGQYRYINSTPVYDGAELETDPMSGITYLRENYKTDTVIGYYAALELVTGYQATLYMTVEELEAHGQRYSPSFDRRNNKFYPGSLWVTNFPAMANKTVLRLLISRDGLIDPGDRAVLDRIEDGDAPSENGFDEDVFDEDAPEIIDVEPEPFDEAEALEQLGF